MATLYEPGNTEVFGNSKTPAGGGPSVEDGIISATKDMAFPSGEVISLENFEHYGDKAAGTQQSLNDMAMLTGKELQESYLAGHPMAAKMRQKVSDR